MIFPNLAPQYYDEKHRDILSRMESFYAESITINQSFWAEADTDTRFEAGDQTLWSDFYGNLPAARRRQFSFNRIRRIIEMVSGHQRRNRKSIISVPIENSDDHTNDQLTKIIMWAAQREGILETVSDSFHGALVTGLNFLHVWVDYRVDPISGDIKVDNCPYNSFIVDPYFTKTDLSDCRAIWKRAFVSRAEAISLLPEKKDEIMSLMGNAEGTGRDGKFQFMPESYNYGYKNLLTYDEYYYRDYRPQKMLVDTQSGESMEWKSNNDQSLKDFLRFYPQITVIEQEIPTVRLAIVVEGKVLYDGPNPLGIDKYPFVPVFGYYNPQMPYFPWRIQGMVRGLRDSQFLYNRRKQIELDIFESQLNSGWIYKENALVNPKDIFMAGQGKGIALKEEAAMTDVQQIQSPVLPPTTLQVSEILGRELQEISGVNEELLGSANDDKAGILSMLRQGAGLTTLQSLFDNLDRSQKILGNILIEVIQNNFTPGKVKRIVNEQPSPEFYNKNFGKYDAAVEDGINTTTQRQMQFAQYLHLREVGVPIPDDVLIEASTVQNKRKLTERLQQQAQQTAQQAQTQSQIQMQEIEARTNLANSRAQADQGLAMERTSRVAENRALALERIAEANKDDEQALLNKVKAIKELEELDIIQLERLMSIANMIKGEERVQKEMINPQPMQGGLER